jgi:alpha-beta hydrolase superfamily lysophospholipase
MNESRVFRIAAALIALHIADVELLEPAAGTSASDHHAAALVPIAVAGAAAWVYPRLRPGLRAGVSLVFGALALAAGVMTTPLLVPVGAVLVALGLWIPWRLRGTGRRRNRLVAAVAVPVVGIFGVLPVGAALWTTGKPRTHIGTFSVPHRDVAFTTSDGLRLSGWYVASHNGAAIVIVHGGGGDRDGARLHAAMLAHAGYGVLLYDARGRGRSQGSPNAYGWTWGPDVDAAISFVEHQRGVECVGALGLSTGADVLLGTASHRHDLEAVVADGTTTESLSDVRHISHGGDLLNVPFFAVQYAAAEVLGDARQMPPLAKLAAEDRGTPMLFIASTWKVERNAAPRYARAAHGELWRVDAGHTAGLREHPRAYTRKVVGFFDRTLLGR